MKSLLIATIGSLFLYAGGINIGRSMEVEKGYAEELYWAGFLCTVVGGCVIGLSLAAANKEGRSKNDD